MPHLAAINPAQIRADQPDGGLAALALLLAFTGQPVAPEQLARESGLPPQSVTTEALVRIARARQRSAKIVTASPRKLDRLALPALAELKDGGFLVLARVAAQQVLVHDPVEGRPKTLPRAEFERRWTGRLVQVGPAAADGEAAPEAPAGKTALGFDWFVPSLLKQKGVLAQVGVASLLLQAVGLATPLFTMVVMDKVLNTGGLSTLDMLVIGMLLVSAFELVMGAARSHLHAFASNRLDVELQTRLFRHLAALPMSYFAASPTGAVAARVQELQTVRAVLTGGTVTAFIDLGFSVVQLALMAWYAPLLTLVVVAAMVLILVLYGVITPVLKNRLLKRAGQTAESQTFLVEAVGGIETVKSLAVEPILQRRWEEQVAVQTRTAFDTERLSQGTTHAATFLTRLMTLVTLWLGAQAVLAGGLTMGQLIAFNMMAGRVLAPAQRLGQLWQQFQQARVSVRRICEVLNVQREVARPSASGLPEVAGRVSFESVLFRYRLNGPEVLKRVSFGVQAGEVVGIVGSSGSGKSTIARLMQRLYVPEAGRITVDGVDLALVDPAWLRRRVGVVLQENFLFNRSVRDNIALADPTLPFERVVEAARLAGAHDFILSLPEAYDTPVGERGLLLSGGQRQRIALARALAADPRILILDEATSALDVESERVIHANMRRICAGRTVFVIAHRLSTVRDCDRILVVEDGELVEEGAHDELLTHPDSRYAALWRYQRGEAPEAPEPAERVREPAE